MMASLNQFGVAVDINTLPSDLDDLLDGRHSRLAPCAEPPSVDGWAGRHATRPQRQSSLFRRHLSITRSFLFPSPSYKVSWLSPRHSDLFYVCFHPRGYDPMLRL